MAIMKCKCKHEAQDELHGMGMRVHNHVPATATKPDRYRCMVCKNEVSKIESSSKKK